MSDNKVVRSIEAPGGLRCVDVFVRPDGSWGFEEYRRDPEEGSGWYVIGYHADARFESEDSAFEAAETEVEWLHGED